MTPSFFQVPSLRVNSYILNWCAFPDPALSENIPSDYMERVRRVHSEGGYGSEGYNYEWKIIEAQKNLLRTHTTAVSARMLYKLAQVTM